MKFVVEVPDGEVFEAAEKPEDLATEIAEVIANEIYDFSSVTVTAQPTGLAGASPNMRSTGIINEA